MPAISKWRKQIFADMTTAWDDTCGGGIWWKKDRHYKNAIANELISFHGRQPGESGARAPGGPSMWSGRNGNGSGLRHPV